MTDEQLSPREKHRAVENYAGGEIQARHGIINKWLLGVYAVLFLWSIYYLIGPFDGWRPTLEFWGWGGMGPGLTRGEKWQGLGGIGVTALSIVLISVVGFFAWVVFLTRKK
jgi:hypothetical protein